MTAITNAQFLSVHCLKGKMSDNSLTVLDQIDSIGKRIQEYSIFSTGLIEHKKVGPLLSANLYPRIHLDAHQGETLCNVAHRRDIDGCVSQEWLQFDIIDIKSEVFEQLLGYIYAGTIPDMDEYTTEVLFAAEKYELEELKMMCEVGLGSTLTIDKAVDMLLLADMHNANELKSTCFRYIASNAAGVRKIESWKKLAKSDRIDLMEQLFVTSTTIPKAVAQ